MAEPKKRLADSKRTRRRNNRGFVDLMTSTRKHRRATRRLVSQCTFSDKVHEPGHKEEGSLKGGKLKAFMYTAGGGIHYH